MDALLLSLKFKFIFAAFAAVFPRIALVAAGAVVVAYSARAAALMGMHCAGIDFYSNLNITIADYVAIADPAVNQKIGRLIDLAAASRLADSIALSAAMLFLAAAVSLFAHHSGRRTTLLNGIAFVSLAMLAVGLFAPAMSFIAYRDLPVIGRTVFLFESKGIASTILQLFSGGAPLAGFLILIFSIVFPLAKLALLALVINRGPDPLYYRILEKIGKWSMADVFTAAILLSYLALNADRSVTTASHIRPGWYFFAGYCLLSLALGHMLSHHQPHNASKGIDENA